MNEFLKNLKEGEYLTISSEIIKESGLILFEKGEKVIVDKIIKKEGFWGRRSGVWYPEEVVGIKLKGYNGEWILDTFLETKNK